MIEKELRARIEAELNARADLIKLKAIEEPYFAALEKALEAMPAERKSATMKEVRAHLWAMVEAKRSDGLDEATAWLHATREFGEPEKVGRALWLQCVKSGRVEVEGAPLTKWQTIGKWALSAIWAFFICASMAVGRLSVFDLCSSIVLSFWLTSMGRSQLVYRNGRWSTSGIFLFAFMFFAMAIGIISDHWQGTLWGDIKNYAALAGAIIYFPIYLRFRKQEIGERPWKSDLFFQRNPIAAEQKYRMEPLITLMIAATLICAYILSQLPQILGLPLTFLVCAATVAAVFTAHRWLAR